MGMGMWKFVPAAILAPGNQAAPRGASGVPGKMPERYACRCSPTLTTFIVLVPPALPYGSPMVSSM